MTNIGGQIDVDSNYVPVLGGKSTITGQAESLSSTGGVLNVNAIITPSPSLLEQIKNQNDYTQVISYLDQGLADERVDTIVHSSVILGASITETFSYVGGAGTYAVSSIILS